MKKTLIALLLIVSNISIAQTETSLTVKESITYKEKIKSDEILSIHTTKSNETGIIRRAKKNFLFDVFDEKLDKIFSKNIEHNKKETFVGELFYENEIKFFTVLSPKKTTRILYCNTFNLKDKTHSKIKLFETTVAKKQSLFSFNNKRQTGFAISPDGNYFAINTDNIKKNVNSYTLRVFSTKTLKLIYSKVYQKEAEKYFKPNDLIINNDKSVLVVGKIYLDGKSNKKKGKANYKFALNKLTSDNFSTLDIELDNEHIQTVVFSKSDSILHLLGFYSEKKVGKIKGGFNFTIDVNTFTIKDKKKHLLPKEVYNDLYGYRKAKKKKKKSKELSNFTIDYVLNDAEDNTFLIAEEFYISQHYVSNGNMGGYYMTTYHYDDILVLKINASGELAWGRSIFKRATSPSYNAFIKNGKLQILLNSGKNLTKKQDGRTKISKGWFESSALYNVSFSTDGKVDYEKIQDNKGKTFYIPFYGTYENNKFIMPSRRGYKRKFMTLE